MGAENAHLFGWVPDCLNNRVHTMGPAGPLPTGQQATGSEEGETCDEVSVDLSCEFARLCLALRSGTLPSRREADNPPASSDGAAAKPRKHITVWKRPPRAEYPPVRRRSMVFPATVGAKPARALLDSGAEAMFISEAYVKRHGLRVRQATKPLKVTLAGRWLYSHR